MIVELEPIAEACLLRIDECLAGLTFLFQCNSRCQWSEFCTSFCARNRLNFVTEEPCKATSCKCALCTAKTDSARLPFFPSHHLFRRVLPSIQACTTSQDARLQKRTRDPGGRTEVAMPFTSI